MANIIKIPFVTPGVRNLLPYSYAGDVRTFCTPYNYTYSMSSPDHEWGEWTPESPNWTPYTYWINRNFIPDSSNPSWDLTENGTTVQISPNNGSGTIHHYPRDYSQKAYEHEITCYIVAKPRLSGGALFKLWCYIPPTGTGDFISLFKCPSGQNKIGIDYYLANGASGERYIGNIVGLTQKYHVFVFRGVYNTYTQSDFAINVDGTFDAFKAPSCLGFVESSFPNISTSTLSWDIKLIAFLSVAESEEVIANNVSILRMLYNP